MFQISSIFIYLTVVKLCLVMLSPCGTLGILDVLGSNSYAGNNIRKLLLPAGGDERINMQSDGNNFYGDVVWDSFNKTSRDEETF